MTRAETRRRAWRVAAGALLLSSAAAAAGDAPAVALERVATSDLGVVFTVEVDAGGMRGRWIVDTGAGRHLVTPALAQRLGLRERGLVLADTAFGTLQGPEVELPPLQLGARRFDAQRALVADVAGLAGPALAGVDGVLGAPLLLDGMLELDLAAGMLRLRSEAVPGCEDALVATPLELRRGLPVVTLRVDAQPRFALVDTGYAGALAMLDDAGPAARARVVTVGPIVRRDVSLTPLPAPALRRALAGVANPADVTVLAGAALLDGALVQLRPREGVLCAQPDERALPGRFGLGLDADDHGLFIDEVVEDSPAARAGLRAGDRVRQWNGAAPTTVRDAWAAVRGADTMTLVVERQGATVARVLRRAHPLPLAP